MEKYHIYEEIGKGRYSQVFKGREKKNIEFVAIKRVDKGRMNKIVNEVQIMHKLDNPHTLRFYDWYETKNNLWLILEYCTGSDMLSLLSQDGHLPEASVRLFGLDMVFALKYLHGMGLLHCDLRPANFLIDEHGILKLSDFKFTRKLPKSLLDSSTSSISKRGTVGYMPDELFLKHGGLHSYESDLFSLGSVLYEMRRGFLPFGNASTSSSHGTGAGATQQTPTTAGKKTQSRPEDEEEEGEGAGSNSLLSWDSPEILQHIRLLRSTDPVFGPDSTVQRAKELTVSANPSVAGRSNPGTPNNNFNNQQHQQYSQGIPPLSPEFADLVSWLLHQRVEQRCDWEGLCAHPFWYSANASEQNKRTPKHLDIKPLVYNANDFPPHPLLQQFMAEARQRRVSEAYEARLEMLLQGKGGAATAAIVRRTPDKNNQFMSPLSGQGQRQLPGGSATAAVAAEAIVDSNVKTRQQGQARNGADHEHEQQSARKQQQHQQQGYQQQQQQLNSPDPSEGTAVANHDGYSNIPGALDDLHGQHQHQQGDAATTCVVENNSTENLVINYYKNVYLTLTIPTDISNDSINRYEQLPAQRSRVRASSNDMVDVDSLLLHSSYDLQVKPLVGNKTIEVFEKYSFKAGHLPLPQDKIYTHLSEVNRATMEELEEHLTAVYKALYRMSHAVTPPPIPTTNSNGNNQANAAVTAATNAQVAVDKERMNLLSYLLSISSVAEVANFVLNSQFLYLLLRYIRGSVNAGSGSESSGSRSKSGSGSGSSGGGSGSGSGSGSSGASTVYAYNVSNNSMFSLPIRGVATTILAIMLRYASTIVPPPPPPISSNTAAGAAASAAHSPPHIIATLVQVLKDTNLYNTPTGGAGGVAGGGVGGGSVGLGNTTAAQPHAASKFLLRKRCIAALGEMIFYVAAQEEEEDDDDDDNVEEEDGHGGGMKARGQNKPKMNQWTFPSGTITVLTRCLKSDMEVAIQHYAAKTIENVLAQGAFTYKKKLIGSEIATRLLALALNSSTHTTAESAAMNAGAGGPHGALNTAAATKLTDAMQATSAMALSHLLYLCVTCSGLLLSKLEPPVSTAAAGGVDSDANTSMRNNTSTFGSSGGGRNSKTTAAVSGRHAAANVANVAKNRPVDAADNSVHSVKVAGHFITKLLEKRGGMVAVIEGLKQILGSNTAGNAGPSPASTSTVRLQQALLNIINILCCSKLVVKTKSVLLGMESVDANRSYIHNVNDDSYVSAAADRTMDLEGSAFISNTRGLMTATGTVGEGAGSALGSLASSEELLKTNDVALRQLRAHVVKTPACAMLLIRLLEQATSPLIKAKVLVSMQLLCTVHPSTALQLTQKRFTILLCNMVESIISSATAGNEPECSLASVINTPGTALGTATPSNANNAGLYFTQSVLSMLRFTYIAVVDGMETSVRQCEGLLTAQHKQNGVVVAEGTVAAHTLTHHGPAASPSGTTQRSTKKPTPQSGSSSLHKTPSPTSSSGLKKQQLQQKEHQHQNQNQQQQQHDQMADDCCSATDVQLSIDCLRAHLTITTNCLSMTLRRLVVDAQFVDSLTRALRTISRLGQTYGSHNSNGAEGGTGVGSNSATSPALLLMHELTQVYLLSLEVLCSTRIIDEIDYSLIINCRVLNPTVSSADSVDNHNGSSVQRQQHHQSVAVASPDPHVNNIAYLRAIVEVLLPCLLSSEFMPMSYDVKLSTILCLRTLFPMLFKCLWLLSDVPIDEADDVQDITSSSVSYCEDAPSVVDTVASYRLCLQQLVLEFNEQFCNHIPVLLLDAPPSPVPQYIIQLLTEVLCVAPFITGIIGRELLEIGVVDSLLSMFEQNTQRSISASRGDVDAVGAAGGSNDVETTPRSGPGGLVDFQLPVFFRNLLEFGGTEIAQAMLNRELLRAVLRSLQDISQQMSTQSAVISIEGGNGNSSGSSSGGTVGVNHHHQSATGTLSPYVESASVSVIELVYFTTQYLYQLLRNQSSSSTATPILNNVPGCVNDIKQICVIVNYMLLVSVAQRFSSNRHHQQQQPQDSGQYQYQYQQQQQQQQQSLSSSDWFYESLIAACVPCILAMYDLIPDTVLSTWLSHTSTTVTVIMPGAAQTRSSKITTNMRNALALLLQQRQLDDGVRSQLLKLLLCVAKAASISNPNPKLKAAVKSFLLDEPMFSAVDRIGQSQQQVSVGHHVNTPESSEGHGVNNGTISVGSASLACKVCSIAETSL